jgi:hypothetical protein
MTGKLDIPGGSFTNLYAAGSKSKHLTYYVIDMFGGIWIIDDNDKTVNRLIDGKKITVYGKDFYEKYIGKATWFSVWISKKGEKYFYNVNEPAIYRMADGKMEKVNRHQIYSVYNRFVVLGEGIIFCQNFVGKDLLYDRYKHKETDLSDVLILPYRDKILKLYRRKGIQMFPGRFFKIEVDGGTLLGWDDKDNVYLLVDCRGCDFNRIEIFNLKTEEYSVYRLPWGVRPLSVDRKGKIFFTLSGERSFSLCAFEPDKLLAVLDKLRERFKLIHWN